MPPPEYCNNEACDQGGCLEADLDPVPDRGGISMSNPARRVENQPFQNITIGAIGDFSLGKAVPDDAVAIDAQIDRDDASDNFIKEKLHICSSSHWLHDRLYAAIGRVTAVIALGLPGLVSPDLGLVQWQE
jgi:hypothetical protein